MVYISGPDFDKNDMGGYRHPEIKGEHTYAQIEEKVFAALKDNVRTVSRIKSHANLDDRDDLLIVIRGMQIDKKIRIVENGNLSAVFLYSEMPKRFWNNGDGTISADLDENFRPSKQLSDDSKEQWIDGSEKPEKTRRGREAKALTPEQVETAAAEEKNGDMVARRLGYNNSAPLYKRFKTEPELKAAFDRGRQKYGEKMQAQRSPIQASDEADPPTQTAATKTPPVKAAASTPPREKSIAEKVEEIASENFDPLYIAMRLGMDKDDLEELFDVDPVVKKAWKRGRAMYDANRRDGHVNDGVTKAVPQGRGGRLDIKPEDVEKLAAEGLADKEIAAKLGIGFATFNTKKSAFPEVREAYDRGRKKLKDSGRFVGNQKLYPWSEGLFLNAATKGMTKKALADELGCHESTVGHILRTHPEYQAAWDQGGNIYNNNNPNAVRPRNTKALRYTPEQLEETAARLGNKTDIAAALGYTGEFRATALGTFCIRRPEYGEALKRGLAQFKEQNHPEPNKDEDGIYGQIRSIEIESKDRRPAFGRHIERFPSTIRMEIGEKDIEPAYVELTNDRRFPVGSRGGLAIKLNINLFETTAEERAAIGDVVEAVQKLEALTRKAVA